MSAQQKEVTVDSLQSSLDDLIKAADATDLIKGSDTNNVEHSGTQGSDGKQGGGRGSYPGGVEIDDLMIGKLANMGFSAPQIAQMSGALKGKAAEEPDADDDDDSDDEEMSGYMGALKGAAKDFKKKNGSMKGFPGLPMGKSGNAGAEPMIKSMEQFRQDPDIDANVDISPFLEALTARTAEQIDAVNGTLAKGFTKQTNTNRAIAGAMHQIGTLIKSQAEIIAVLGQRLGVVEKQPQPQKGVTTAQALHKAMPGEQGKPPTGGARLSKSEVLSTLSYMNLEKGIKHINGTPTVQAIGMLEAGNLASEDVLNAAHQFHAQNPNESAVARQYT